MRFPTASGMQDRRQISVQIERNLYLASKETVDSSGDVESVEFVDGSRIGFVHRDPSG